MSERVRRPLRWVHVLSLLVAGLGIGWLTGLSASPVAAGLIAGLIGVSAGVITGLQTISTPPAGGSSHPDAARNVDPVPAALVILGIAIAAPLGILARTHRIFEPTELPSAGTTTPKTPYQGVLFRTPVEDCDKLTALAAGGEKAAFIGEFSRSSPTAKALAEKVPDYDTLKRVVEALCETK